MKDFITAAAEIGELVTEKNAAYGDSFDKCGEFLRLLWPEGIPVSQYGDALCMCRIFDKQMRVATRKDAFGESPYRDIAGYGVLGMVKDETTDKKPLSPTGEGSDTIVKDATAESLCHTCQRNKGCIGDYPRTKDGGCEGYCLPPITVPPPAPLRERILDAKQEVPKPPSLCRLCAVGTTCGLSTPWREICDQYEAKQEAPTAAEQPLDFTLPSIALKCTAEEAAEKFWSEREEWKAAEKDSLHELVERWDCLQALYTFAERGGDVEWYQDHVRVVMEDLARCHADRRDVMKARRELLWKNAKRGYYAPEINAEIIASGGHSFTPKEADA